MFDKTFSDYFMEDFFMTFNVFMTVDRLCTLLMSYYNETVKTDDRYHGEEGGFDLKATEQKKIRLNFKFFSNSFNRYFTLNGALFSAFYL